ncbi:MAG: 4-hydroxy-3-methylbut-2-enyl diphosphate reductase [Bacteroidales bacterium]|jgi:4-hydroxy-3-methylbut-2-enyl diphosphate reductase|nr:4-hydroxy-3-methylbut-2-enyl diphosphate reductase [Bacteroidales bacterium]
MNIEIDNKSGFCFGVVNAIQLAEMELGRNETLYCLGDIVHNNAEVERLKLTGLVTIDHEKFKTLKNCKVLLRAHGEPPETYETAIKNNIQLIDASCPVVLKLQNNIKIGFDSILKKGGQVLIYGKEGHAEVNALVGQTNGKAIVIGGINDLNKVDFSKPINLFSQTTKSIEGFYEIQNEIKRRMLAAQKTDNIEFIVNDTICRQVSHRQPQLRNFVKNHDVVIFVSGQKSSNGKMLYQVCKEENPNTYFVSDIDELKSIWFKNSDSIGVCGATSTPRWLMEKIAKNIEILSI